MITRSDCKDKTTEDQHPWDQQWDRNQLPEDCRDQQQRIRFAFVFVKANFNLLEPHDEIPCHTKPLTSTHFVEHLSLIFFSSVNTSVCHLVLYVQCVRQCSCLRRDTVCESLHFRSHTDLVMQWKNRSTSLTRPADAETNEPRLNRSLVEPLALLLCCTFLENVYFFMVV